MRAPVITKTMQGDGIREYDTRYIYDVKNPPFNAKGDGVTDDSSAIQAAIDAVPISDIASIIHLAHGEYLINSTLVISSGRRIVFRGADVLTGSDCVAIIKTTDPNLLMLDASSLITNVFSMIGIQFLGPGKGTGTGDAVRLGRAGTALFDSRIENNWFTGIPNRCLDIVNMDGCHIVNNGIENCEYGMYLTKGLNLNIALNRFYSNEKAAIYWELGVHNSIQGNHFDICGENNDVTGALVINNSGVDSREFFISGNKFDKNFNDIILLGTVAGNQGINNAAIVGNISDFAKRHFLYVNEAKRTFICSNRINDTCADGGLYGGNLPAIDILGNSDGTILFGNANTLQSANADSQAIYGLQLGADTTNTVLGTNAFNGKTGRINIISGATFANPAVTPATVHTIGTLTAVDTPSVAGRSVWLSGSSIQYNNFVNGFPGQVITIIAEHAITVTDGTNIFLDGSTNFVMTETDTLTLIQKADGKWYEISRSDSGA